MTVQIAVRLPDAMVEQLDELVAHGHQSRSEAVRRAIELYLYRIQCERDARRYDELPLTDRELALADAPGSWDETPSW